MKNKGKFYTCLYIVCVLLFFIFVVWLTIWQTAVHVGESNTTSQPTTITTLPPSTTTSIELLDKPILFSELANYEFNTIESVDVFICEVDNAIELLLEECAISDKYTAEAITAMLEEIDRLTAAKTYAASQRVHMVLWIEKEEEYYYATRTWKYLKELGYSDAACAGIIGNAMAECGGLTLELQPFVYDPAGQYYGIFQWSLYYCPEVDGIGFEEQLEYYRQTSASTFKIWGKNYAEGFTLDDFNALTDPRDAALAFAKIYERCASWTYGIRQDLAEIAYQYFVLDFKNP